MPRKYLFMILLEMTQTQRQAAFFTALMLLFIAIIVLRSIRVMQFYRAQANAYNALATAIEEGAPVTIPISVTVNSAKFPSQHGNTDN